MHTKSDFVVIVQSNENQLKEHFDMMKSVQIMIQQIEEEKE